VEKTLWARVPNTDSDHRKAKIQNRKWAGLFAIVVPLTVCAARAEAQQPTKVPRIGFLANVSLTAISSRTEAFRQGLRELGYVEGKNIVIEYRYAEGNNDRLPALIAELVRLKIDVIISAGPAATRAAKEATSTRRAEAFLVLQNPVATSQRTQITDLAVKNRLPAIYDRAEFVEAGGLMTYGVSGTDLFRRAATDVDKILKGAKPADLPVEQPTKFELVINLKTAKQIGLTIPPNVLARADKVIR